MTVGPSPRVEYRIWHGDRAGPWRESAPAPNTVSLLQMAARLFYNRQRNTQLYMVALAERQIAVPSEHSLQELHALIASRHSAEGPAQQFRLVFIMRDGARMMREVLYESEIVAAGQGAR